MDATELKNQLLEQGYVSAGAGVFVESTNGGRYIPLRKWHINPFSSEAQYFMRYQLRCDGEWTLTRKVNLTNA
jgi:hypothetical protein